MPITSPIRFVASAALIYLTIAPNFCVAADAVMHAVSDTVPTKIADHSAALRHAVDAAIRPLMTTYAVPGIAVAVTIDGRASFFNYGLANLATAAPVRETTLFEVGSISKTFTATLGAYAQALGALSLDDHPGQYLAALKGRPIDLATLQQLATYTAGGLPLQFPDAVKNDAAMIDYFRDWQPAAAPGAQRLYSNPSIGLFGLVTARALQRDFAEVMQTTLLPKLGLQHTFLQVPKSAAATYAWGYNKANQPTRVSPGVFDAQAYGIKSSSADVLRFVQANIAPDTLERPVMQAVRATQLVRYRSGALEQGLGWEQYPYPVTLAQLLEGNGEAMLYDANAARAVAQLPPANLAARPSKLFNKTGSTNGFGAYVAFVPAARIGVVLLANKSYPIAARVTAAHAILAELARQSSGATGSVPSK